MPASRRRGKPGAGPSRLRSFDPARIAGLEYQAWLAYYRRDWLRLLAASKPGVAVQQPTVRAPLVTRANRSLLPEITSLNVCGPNGLAATL